MRVLSLIPAFLAVAASFVAAAPASVPSCTPGSVSAPGCNDAPLQPVIAIIANATLEIQPLSDQLTALQGQNPDADAVSGIVVQITTVISTCVAQLQATAQVDVTGLDLTNLCSTIYALLELVLTILNALVAIVLAIGVNAVVTLQVVLTNLLNAVVGLTGCLKVFVTASLTGVLVPVMALVCGVIDLLQSLVGGLHLIAGAN